MAIIEPDQLPIITRLGRRLNDQLKFDILAALGHPVVNVEITEQQMESAIRTTHDYMVSYFPLEEKYAFFYTTPLESEYSLPSDAYWVSEVVWDPGTSEISDVFSIDYIVFNAANITGYQTLISDFHLIRSYQKFANRVLGLEGKWEYLPSNETIKLYPVPKGSFPVIVRYVPRLDRWKTPQARQLSKQVMVAEVKKMVGAARRKMQNVPSPDGSTLGLDGDALVAEGKEEYKEAVEAAIKLSEPLRPYWM